MALGESDRNPVELLSEEFLERIRRGEAVTPEEYARQHPELADEILALFPALLMMEDLGDETSDQTHSIGDASSAIVGATAGRLGEFRLLREVGRGGMGVVYEAEQESLGRRVALKVLPHGALPDLKQVRRFEREARSAARLHHTNIVPIFGVGEHEGTHYYVMQFIQGQGLDAVLAELKKLRDARTTHSLQSPTPRIAEKGRGAAADIAQSLVSGRFASGAEGASVTAGASATETWSSPPSPLAVHGASHSDASFPGMSTTSGVSTLTETDRRYAKGVARIGIQVADALAHAHGQGILHRDIKPSNLLLDREGNVWVTDFGLAKATGGEDLTHTGDIIGTVRYMAPERFQGAGDLRADLYALGLTLYELLALRPAFDENDRASLVRQVTQEDPPQLRKLNRHVPPDLETVIHKAIARDPARRYETARAMSDDLQRFLDGRPILARRVSPTERLYRWTRRNPALAASLGSIAILLVATTIGSIIMAARFRNAAESARIAAAEAEESRAKAEISSLKAVEAGHEAEARRAEADTQRLRAQASLAESQANLTLARKAVDNSFTKVSENSLLNVPGLRPLRRDLLESALTFYEELIRRGGDDPSVLADLAATQARVGQIHSDLGAPEKAKAALRRAVELYDKTLAVRPNDVTLLERKSEVWHRLGDLDYRTQAPVANAAYQKAVAIRERLVAEHPAEPRFRMALSRSYNGVAITSSGNAQLDPYRRSLELRLKLAGEIPDDPDLLHGLNESFINLASLLWNRGHQSEALDLTNRSIEYGHAGFARRPHDLEFAMDLATSYSETVNFSWRLGRRDESLAISADGVAYLRKLASDNPDVRLCRVSLANTLAARGWFVNVVGRTDEAVALTREAAQLLETIPDPEANELANATYLRGRVAVLLAGKSAQGDLRSWPDAARREADSAVADLKAAVAKGFRGIELFRQSDELKPLFARDDMKALLAQMEQPQPAPSSPAKPEVASAPASPLRRPGKLEEDRLLGELTVGLLEGDGSNPAQARRRLEAVLARIDDARRNITTDSTALDQSANTIRMKLGEQLWHLGDLLAASRLWDESLAPIRALPVDNAVRRSALARFTQQNRRISDLFAQRGLWEQASLYDELSRVGNPIEQAYRPFESGLLALARGDLAAFRTIVAATKARATPDEDFELFDALRIATLSTECHVPPDELHAMADRLRRRNRSDSWKAWFAVAIGGAFFRAGRDREALAILEQDGDSFLVKPFVALIHARAGRAEQASRWLESLERDVEARVRHVLLTVGSRLEPDDSLTEILYYDLLRREAYRLLAKPAPEIRSLRLLRADALWRLNERDRAETELATAVAGARDDVAALIDRARTLENLGEGDRALRDLSEAARRRPDDPRPWVVRGKLLAERGVDSEADAAYSRAVALAPGRLDPFIEAGWWLAGPYPEDINQAQSPEFDPHPAKPVSSATGSVQRWQPVPVNEDRFLRLDFAARPASSSLYALTHLASDRDRTALLCVNASSHFRLWLNGRLVFDSDKPHIYHFGPESLAPVTLRAGRNTLLVKVSHNSGGHSLRLRSEDLELDHGALLAEFGRWSEAADCFDRAEERGQFLHSWPKARQVELIAALGDRDRWKRSASKLADWCGSVRPDPYDVARTLALDPNNLVSPERLIELARQGVASNPGEPWRPISLALAYYRAGRFAEARDLLAPQSTGGHNIEAPIRAMAHWRLGEKAEARKALAQVDAEFEKWCRERSSGQMTSWASWWCDGPAIVVMRREAHTLIDGHAPDDKTAFAGIRTAMGNLIDDRDSPTWAFDLAFKLDPGNAEYRAGLAARLLELGRSAEAERLLTEMLTGKTNQPQAWVDRASVFGAANLPDRAAADLDQALKLMPENFDIWGPRARLCDALTLEPAVYDRLLELRPADALLWYVRAEKRLIERRFGEAIADFNRPGEPPATTEFAYIYAAAILLSGDESRYREYVNRLAEQHSDSSDPNTNFVLARLAALAQHPALPPEHPVAWARTAVANRPQYGWFAHALALAYLRAGDHKAAKETADLSSSLGWSAAGKSLNDLVAAVIDVSEGRAVPALTRFERLKGNFDPVPSTHTESALMLTDWLEFQILKAQIELPLLDAAFPENPFGG